MSTAMPSSMPSTRSVSSTSVMVLAARPTFSIVIVPARANALSSNPRYDPATVQVTVSSALASWGR